MPQMGESITEGTITKWLKKVGDTVQRDEPIFEISTDKVDAEIPSPVAGTLTEIKVPEGSTVGINTVVAVIGGGAGSCSGGEARRSSSRSREGTRSCSNTRTSRCSLSRRTPALLATGPQDRLREQRRSHDRSRHRSLRPHHQAGHHRAHQRWRSRHSTAAAAAPAASAKPAAPAAPTYAPMPGELVPMSKMRAIIAKRMVESKQTSAHVHTVFKVDMTRIVKLREKEKNKYEQRNGVKLTYMPFITRAAIHARASIPSSTRPRRAMRSATTRTSTSASPSRWSGASSFPSSSRRRTRASSASRVLSSISPTAPARRSLHPMMSPAAPSRSLTPASSASSSARRSSLSRSQRSSASAASTRSRWCSRTRMATTPSLFAPSSASRSASITASSMAPTPASS